MRNTKGVVKIPKQLQSENYRFVLLKPKSKIPIEKKWESEKNYTFDNSKLLNHLKKGGNYGVVVGFANLICIDADSKEIDDKCKLLPDTFKVKTGSPEKYKNHYFFIADKEIKPIRLSKKKVGDLGDIRSTGQYVVGPNCIHPSGNPYRAVNEIKINKISEAFIKTIFKDYTNHLSSETNKKTKDKQYKIDTTKRLSDFVKHCKVPDYTLNNKLPENISKNWELFPYIIDVLNARDVSPNLYETLAAQQGHEISAVKGWVKKANEGKLAKTSCKKMLEYLEHYTPDLINTICGECRLYKKIEEKKEIEKEIKGYPPHVKFGRFGSYVDIDGLVDEIRKAYEFVTIYGKTGEEIFCYENGIWKPNGREIIESVIEIIMHSWSKTRIVNEVVKKIKRQTAISREDFDKTPNELLPLKNGVLNFKTNEFLDYSPKYYFKTKINVDYNPQIDCEEWKNFVKNTFYPDDIPVIQEWIGFCLYRNYFIKKGFLGVGEADTGKSVFQNVLFRFFGPENTSGISLQKLSRDNNFQKASLYNKHINLYDDMSSQDINDTGGFKMFTGRSPITAEYKFNDPFQFINFSKLTFCCNKIPPIKDTNDFAYYNRWIPIAFDNVVPEAEQNKFLIEKLTTLKELSGILNWGLAGLKRLLKTGKFSYNKTTQEIKNIMDRSSHPLARFAQECLKQGKQKITATTMYEYYTFWAKQKSLPLLSKAQLGRQLPLFATYLTNKRESIRFWDNVELNTEIDTLDAFLKNQGFTLYTSLYYNKKNNKKHIYNISIGIEEKASNPSKNRVSELKPYFKPALIPRKNTPILPQNMDWEDRKRMEGRDIIED